jgi:anthranilate synthase component 1
MPDQMRIIRDVNDNGVVAVQSLACDTVTPVGAYSALVGDANGFLLESVPVAYSFVGRFEPGGIIEIAEGEDNPWSRVPVIRSPLTFDTNSLPPFIGGYVGYIGYDMVRGVEELPRPGNASGFPDALLGRVDTLLVFDHLKQDLRLIQAFVAQGLSDDEALARGRRGFEEVDDALHSGRVISRAQAPRVTGVQEVSPDDAAFAHAVLKAKDYLYQGDIMQVVLSRRLRIDLDGDPFDIYRRLRRINPSPYLFYIRIADVTLIGSSPRRWCGSRGTPSPRSPSPGLGPGAGRPLRTTPWRTTSWRTRRSGPSTSCSWTSPGTTWAGCRCRERCAWCSGSRSACTRTSCTSSRAWRAPGRTG